VQADAAGFILAGTSISIANIGNCVISVAFVFPAPAFEDFMRAGSVRGGEKDVHLSKAAERDT
jgi:hypothetical protein